MYSYLDESRLIRSSDGAVFSAHDGLELYEEYKAYIANGGVAPIKTLAQISKEIDAAFDEHIDSVASQRGYKRAGVTPSASCIGYAGYPNPYQAEAIKFGQWVADCCAMLIAERAKVEAGIRTMPSPAQAISELPPMEW